MSVTRSEVGRLAHELYGRLRKQVETPENIGKMITIDVDTGDFEIDEKGIESSFRLQAKHPGARLFGIRIGYRTAEAIGGVLERSAP
jgi:hypothetical protein